MRRSSLAPSIALASLIVLALCTGFASASYPGTNGRIAFTTNTGASGGYGDIFSMNPDGSDIRQLTTSFLIDSLPSWSPDGRKIAYSGNVSSSNAEVLLINADGSGRKALTNDPAADGDPTWSPDGGRIAFTSNRSGNQDIYVMNADGTGVAQLTSDGNQDVFPSWSPDGSRIAFASNRGGSYDIYSMNPDGSDQVDLTRGTSFDGYPSWSPDGTRIAFASSGGAGGDIYVMNRDGSDVTRLTDDPAEDEYPAWSPDGSKIVFASTRTFDYDIWIMNADGSDQHHVPGTTRTDDQYPDWQPLPGYPRPRGATPLRVPLVPAFARCSSPNDQHGAPLADGSCNPPAQASSWLTLGTPDSNGQRANSVGSALYRVLPGDLQISVSTTDVRNKSDLSDYVGELEADQTLRITDLLNGPSQNETGTMQDVEFPVTVSCTPTADPGVGSTCAVSTSANAVSAGSITAGYRAIWELGQVKLYDGGSGGTSGASDATLFEGQGLFVP